MPLSIIMSRISLMWLCVMASLLLLSSIPVAVAGFHGSSDFKGNSTNGTDIGLCLRVAHEDCGEDKEDHVHCRNHDNIEYICNKKIEGCWWFPLLSCGDGLCIDWYTNDEDTMALFLGIWWMSILVVLCCSVFLCYSLQYQFADQFVFDLTNLVCF